MDGVVKLYFIYFFVLWDCSNTYIGDQQMVPKALVSSLETHIACYFMPAEASKHDGISYWFKEILK